MEKARLGPLQLFALMFLFELGTTVVVPLGLDAKKDAWLSILLAMLCGFVPLLVYMALYSRYPAVPLTGYVRQILGNIIGCPIAFCYVLFFVYGAARDLRDVGNLLYNAVYDLTPIFILNALMVLGTAYVLAKGIEVLARTGEVFFFVIILLGTVGNLLVQFSGIVSIDNLLPVLENGWGPVVKTALFRNFMSPFGEVICFAMLFPYLQNVKGVLRAGMASMLLGGLALCLTISVEIATLGADIARRSTFPLLTTISKVDIANFLQRLDAIVVFTLIITVFFKVAIYYYAAVVGTADLFREHDHRKLVIPIGIVILFMSIMIAGSFSEHIQEGKFAVRTVYFVFALIIPLVLLVLSFWRKRSPSRGTPTEEPVRSDTQTTP